MVFLLYPQILFTDLLKNSQTFNPFDWNCKTALFSLGRTALLNGVRLLKDAKQGSSELLVPAYMCEDTLWPIRDAGFKLRYYLTNDVFKIEMADLEPKINTNTLAILVVHYFGISQELTKIKFLCEKKGVFLIEDCSQSLFGKSDSVFLGSQGDISIFSMRKHLPLMDGGALVINNQNLYKYLTHSQTTKNTIKINYAKAILQSFRNSIEYTLGLSFRNNQKIYASSIEQLCPRSNREEEKKSFVDHEPISPYSKKIFQTYDYAKMALRRSENYNVLANALKNLKQIDLPYLNSNSGWSPYALPVYTPKTKQLDIIKALVHQGIFVSDWPTLPIDLVGKEKERAYSMLNRIILFPVHQNISKNKMIKMSNKCYQTMKSILS